MPGIIKIKEKTCLIVVVIRMFVKINDKTYENNT